MLGLLIYKSTTGLWEQTMTEQQRVLALDRRVNLVKLLCGGKDIG